MISTKDIYYFEVFDHNVRARTKSNVYDYRESLKNIEDMSSGGNFVRPHNSYLINLEHVISTTQSEFIMKDGRVISISRKRKDDVVRALHQYLRR
jgi:DNA-binding LytR/AlgR family response regulator